MDRVRAGHHIAEEALGRHVQDVDDWHVQALKLAPGDEEFIKRLYVEQQDDAANGYPHILRSSLFTTAYAIFEVFLNSLCKELEAHIAGAGLHDLRGEGIQRARLYLAKVVGVTFPDTDAWERLVLYGKLRNAMVHSQGDLTDNRNLAAIKQLQAKHVAFELSDDESAVRLSAAFTLHFLETVEIFASELDGSLYSVVINDR